MHLFHIEPCRLTGARLFASLCVLTSAILIVIHHEALEEVQKLLPYMLLQLLCIAHIF